MTLNKSTIFFIIIIGSLNSYTLSAKENKNSNSSSLSYKDMKLSHTKNRDKLVESLLKACPLFLLDIESREKIYHNMVYPTVAIPMPGNVRQNYLKRSKNIALIISGNNGNPSDFYSETQKMVCLNHLAFAYSRAVPAYRFLDAKLFNKHLTDIPPHWLKVIALKTLLPQIEPNKWIMWVDDDVVTSDFHPKQDAYIDVLIDSYAKEGTPNRPSMLISSDPFTGINTGIVLIRNSQEGRELLERWWETRVDDIKNPYYCNRTNSYYSHLKLCREACYPDYTCTTPCPSNINLFTLHDQEALYQMLISSKNNSYQNSTNAMLYANSHVVVIFPQKHDVDNRDDIDYVGINTFFIELVDTVDEAKAIHPSEDAWVQVPGLGESPDKRSLHLIAWLSRISDLYPYKHTGSRWKKYFHNVIGNVLTDSDDSFNHDEKHWLEANEFELFTNEI